MLFELRRKIQERQNTRINGAGSVEYPKRTADEQDKHNNTRLVDKSLKKGRKQLPGLRRLFYPVVRIGQHYGTCNARIHYFFHTVIFSGRNEPGHQGSRQHYEKNNDIGMRNLPLFGHYCMAFLINRFDRE